MRGLCGSGIRAGSRGSKRSLPPELLQNKPGNRGLERRIGGTSNIRRYLFLSGDDHEQWS